MRKIYYEDRTERISGRDILIRELGDISRKNLDASTLRHLTNGRYPSFYTFSHACGGSDNAPSLSLEWFNDKSYSLLEEEIKPGICVASPCNDRNSAHIPLFIFGSQNSAFIDFLRNKYSGLLQKEKMDRLISKRHFSRTRVERYPEEKDSYYKGCIGGLCFDSRVANVLDIEKISHVYGSAGVGFGYDAPYSAKVETDYGVLFNLPIWSDDCDGSYITTDGSVSFDLEGKVQQVKKEKRKPLKWGDAEMMIDLFGLFDGKKKIIFFNQQ